eukprot:GHVL01000762.1.p1 GENE.GHVL01000762.1~~GHVL01000762.1.p1  ORF type:complete len:698 (+),score=158.50 GHVL01000762.1:232-2094(+)
MQSICTFGFRGEALASISFVSHVSITTFKEGSPYALLCKYRNGELIEKPKPCAGTRGTTVTFEDLFYNMPLRKRVTRSASEEYSAILDVIQKYSIYFSMAAISCRKQGSSQCDVSTPGNLSRIEAVQTVYGGHISKELIEFEAQNTSPKVLVSGLVSNANFSTKRLNLFMFINNRLVECNSIRRAVASCYEEFLPRGGHPWVFLSMKFPSNLIDVNCHPTKKNVQFIDEDLVATFVHDQLKECLKGQNLSRTFESAVPMLPLQSTDLEKQKKLKQQEKGDKAKIPATNPVRVRTDNSQIKLTNFLPTKATSNFCTTQNSSNFCTTQNSDEYIDNKMLDNNELAIANQSDDEETDVRLAIENESVDRTLKMLLSGTSETVSDWLKDSVWVGPVDTQLALIQAKTRLLLVNLITIGRHLAYVHLLRYLGSYDIMKFRPPLPLSEMLWVAIQFNNSGFEPEGIHKGVDPRKWALKLCQKLIDNRLILSNYFNINFLQKETDVTVKETDVTVKETDVTVKETDVTVKETDVTVNEIVDNIFLCEFPRLPPLGPHQLLPDLKSLPLCLLRLATQESSIQSISRILSHFFVALPSDLKSEYEKHKNFQKNKEEKYKFIKNNIKNNI